MKSKISLQGIIIPFFYLFLISSSAFGQEESEQTGRIRPLQYGIKAGITGSRFSSEQPHNNCKPGIIAGIFFNYPISSSFSLQLEPSYLQQGGYLISIIDHSLFLDANPPFSIEINDQKVIYHNIDLPFLVKYEKKSCDVKFFGVIGPAFGINLNSTSKTDVSARSNEMVPVYYDFIKEENISSDIRTMQYGIATGLGFESPLGKHSLIFDIRYRYSINTTWPAYSYLGVNHIQGDLKSNTFYVTLGLGF